jgi:hypothetical protein
MQEINYKKEELIIERNYPINMLFRYSNKQINKIVIEGEELQNNNNTVFEISQLSDFIFIVREKNIERDKLKKIEKEWYTGYIGFLNVTIQNETHNMLSVYDDSLNDYLGTEKLRRLSGPEKIDVNLVREDNKLCLAKIDFYKNGTIKNYFLPKEFSINNFIYIEEAAKLLIPKISKSLFDKNINETLSEINDPESDLDEEEIENNTLYYEEEELVDDFLDDIEVEEEEENDEDNDRIRILSNKNYSIKTKQIKIVNKRRRMSSNNYTSNISNNLKDVKFSVFIEDENGKV